MGAPEAIEGRVQLLDLAFRGPWVKLDVLHRQRGVLHVDHSPGPSVLCLEFSRWHSLCTATRTPRVPRSQCGGSERLQGEQLTAAAASHLDLGLPLLLSPLYRDYAPLPFRVKTLALRLFFCVEHPLGLLSQPRPFCVFFCFVLTNRNFYPV